MNKNIKIFLAIAIAIILICCLAACTGPAGTSERAGQKNGSNCGHELYDGDNIVPHDEVGYCGNIQITVKYAPMGEENDNWEKVISGSPAVKLTDMFMWLDYSEPTCDCGPEYTITSEGGEVYGLSLTEGYARHGDLQVSLTEAQVDDLKETMTAIAEYEGDMLMYRQVEE